MTAPAEDDLLVLAAARDGSAPTRVDGVEVLGALSPSRAADFKTCALLYRLRAVDRIPEEPSGAAVRGTVVHAVLESLFDLPPDQRTPEQAAALLPRAWAALAAAEPALAGDDDGFPQGWQETCEELLRAYFTLEDPRTVEPAEREVYVEALLGSGLLLRGVVDRLDVAADGALRVVDYKTGSAPRPGFESRALFQLRFYALVLWRTRGVVPKVLRLLYLGDAQTVSYEPDEADLLATERQLRALWQAISQGHDTGEWAPQPGGHCRWCSFREHCPEFGGTPPPWSPDAAGPGGGGPLT